MRHFGCIALIAILRNDAISDLDSPFLVWSAHKPYIGSVFFAHPNALAVLKGTFLPTVRWDNAFLATLVAILGTTISPTYFSGKVT